MRKSNNSNGYTLIELLAVITIISILLAISVAAVVHFIDKARNEQRSSQEKTITMAAENYLQENRSLLPKNVGETSEISVSILKDKKYLNEDIRDGNGKSCMENSFVTVQRKTKTKYIYTAHLYCGDEQPS